MSQIYKFTPEMRTPLYHQVPKVSTIEGFHCTANRDVSLNFGLFRIPCGKV